MTQNATDFENQVVNLVKAAMSGDEEANDVIVQIIEAAKKGDEQALKVVALIKQLTQSNSDQAEEGAEENTEAMKCGGKVRAKMKAKKCETGGEVLEEKCGGAAKKNSAASKVRKSCKAKKCENGDTLTDTQKFLLGAKCGAKMKKPKKCESGDHIEELEDYLAVKCGGKMKKTKKHEEGGQISLDFSQIDFAKCGKKLKKKEDGGEIAEEKCGGKAKKVKKGEVGVRLPEGAHGQTWSKSTSSTTVFSKGGKQCPCALKRIGGKIVTVDTCTGLPVHKQGGPIKKYQDPAGAITYNPFFGDKFMYDPDKRQFYIFDRNGEWQEIAWDQLKDKRGSQEFITKVFENGYDNPINNLYLERDDNAKVRNSRTGRFPNINSSNWGDTMGTFVNYIGGKYVINPGTDNEETLDFSQFYDKYPTWRSWSRKYNNVGYQGEEIPYKDGKAQWDPAQQKYVYKIQRTVSTPAAGSEWRIVGFASDSGASQSAAATAGSSTTAQQGATAAATSTPTDASSQSGSKQNFAEWIKQNAPQYQSYQERKKLAEKYGIQNYTGSLQQNLQMWNMMKNDRTLNSQASQEADVIREATRVAPLPVPTIAASKKVEIPTISSADIRSNSVSTPLTLKTEPIKLPTIRLANRETPQESRRLHPAEY